MSEMTLKQLENVIDQLPLGCGVYITDAYYRFGTFRNIYFGYIFERNVNWSYDVCVPCKEMTSEECLFLSITSGKTIKTPQEVYNDLVVEGVFKL
jgi:hypothetical protein